MATLEKINIFYDDECPFCSKYTQYLNLKSSFGQPNLVNVRQDPEALAQLRALSFDVDRAMVVQVGERYYTGAQALQILASMSTHSDWFNKINGFIFSTKWLAWLLYPIMALSRNITLAILGRSRITPHSVEDRHTLDLYSTFAFGWAFYTLFHFCYLTFYSASIAPPPNVLSWVMAGLAVGVILSPRDTRLFSGLVAVAFVEMWSQMPMTSNHAIVDFFFLLAILLCGMQALMNRLSWPDFFRLFAPAGRWLLIIMYFYGIFHKINTDFLDPEFSCAVALWEKYPLPHFLSGGLWFHYAAIYGTFVIEGSIIIALLIPRLRYYAVIAGCVFHLFLGVSSYAFYGPFSMLSFALHLLFLPDTFLEDLRKTRIWKAITTNARLTKTVLIGFFLALYLAAYTHNLTALIVLFFLAAVPLLGFVCQARSRGNSGVVILRPGIIPACIALAFFLNNAAPYTGLKTQQSMNMFSNLYLDGNRTNHLIFTHPPTLFPYLKDTVMLINIKVPEQIDIKSSSKRIVYHDFLSYLSLYPTYKVTYERNGVIYKDRSFSDLQADFDEIARSPWTRKWMLFEGIDTHSHRSCEGFQ